MARRKDPNEIAKWTVCRAIHRPGTGTQADIMWGDIVIDTIGVSSTRVALASVCRDYMSRLAPSNSAMEVRRARFAHELKKRHGIEPNDCGDPVAHDVALALWVRDFGWSLHAGIDAYLKELAEKYDLDRIDKM